MTAVEQARPSRRDRRRLRAEYTAAAEAGRGRELQLVASAIDVKTSAPWLNKRWGGGEWQTEGWLHYDTCPEFRSGVDLRASAMSRARLVGVNVDPETGELGSEATDDPDVRDIVAQLFGGPGGQAQSLSAMSRHWDVSGDFFVLATFIDDELRWQVVGVAEVTVQTSGTIHVLEMDGSWREVDLANELMMRVWKSHPARRWEADSMTRALLPVLRELASLTAMVSATVKSRLASAGILWLPADLTPTRTDPGLLVTDTLTSSPTSQAQYWLDLLTEAMTAPIADPDSAAAVVPIVATVSAERIGDITHMEFGHDLDVSIDALRTSTVGRLSVGMSLPNEYMTGQGDINHWTGWLIAEDFRKIYLAPPAEAWADALTRYYLRPMLRQRGKDPALFALGTTFTGLQPEQITIESADKAFAAGLLKEVRYAEVLGFSVTDMPDPAERGRRLIEMLIGTGRADALAALAPAIPLLYPGAAFIPIDVPEKITISEQGPAPGPPVTRPELPPGETVTPAATGVAPNGGVAPAPPSPGAP